MKVKAWKIRNKETGEFSKGGTYARHIWTKGGKTWSNIGHVKNHMNSFIGYNGELSSDYPYHNAEIVEVEIDYEECFTYDVSVLVEDMRSAKEKKAQRAEELHEKWIREKELKKLAELQKKYGVNANV